jgi:hypothetical protein
MLGTRLFLRDQSLRANMISFSPVGFEHREILLDEGLEPASFLPVPGIAEAMASQGIETHVLINGQYTKGGLSDIFFRGVTTVHSYVPGSAADLWITLRRFLEQRVGQRMFISVYWGVLDALSHARGPQSPAIDAELGAFTELMISEFLNRVSPDAASGTLFEVVADHGQLETPPHDAVRLAEHPELVENLWMGPLGEQRFAYLVARQGRIKSVRRYVQQHLGHAFAVIDSRQALKAGLFGLGNNAPETAARLGDIILVSRGSHILYDEGQEPYLLGLHGGLSAEEMIVPLFLMRLDA